MLNYFEEHQKILASNDCENWKASFYLTFYNLLAHLNLQDQHEIRIYFDYF